METLATRVLLLYNFTERSAVNTVKRFCGLGHWNHMPCSLRPGNESGGRRAFFVEAAKREENEDDGLLPFCPFLPENQPNHRFEH